MVELADDEADTATDCGEDEREEEVALEESPNPEKATEDVEQEEDGQEEWKLSDFLNKFGVGSLNDVDKPR